MRGPRRAVGCAYKWHFSSDFRIIVDSQNCSEVVRLPFSNESSPKHAAGMGLAVHVLALIVLCLAQTATMTAQAGKIIEDIKAKGNRRIPNETIMAKVYTRPGDVYDEAALQRDLRSVWATGYFEDVRIEREESPKGWRIWIYVREKPTIRSIDYHGLNSVSVVDVLEQYKKIKLSMSVESSYDPTKIIKAQVALKELLSEHGRQFATITSQIQQFPPASVAVTINVKEGPKIKVGKITFVGNKHITDRVLLRAMKNLHPIGIPNSIFLESIFAKTFDSSKLEEDAERVRSALQEHGYFKALVADPKTQLREKSSGFPLVFKRSPGKSMDITMPIEENDKYTLKSIVFKNNKAIVNTQLLRNLFP